MWLRAITWLDRKADCYLARLDHEWYEREERGHVWYEREERGRVWYEREERGEN